MAVFASVLQTTVAGWPFNEKSLNLYESASFLTKRTQKSEECLVFELTKTFLCKYSSVDESTFGG